MTGQLPLRAALGAGWPYASALVGLVALTACQSVDGGATGLDLGDTPAAVPTEYPSLYTVPPRPRLSYSVQQRRTIVEGLVGDRELARYTDQVVRYRSGQSSLPPPPAPPREVAALDTAGLLEPAPPEPESTAPAVPEGPSPYDDDGGFGSFDDDDEADTLGSFVDDLARDPLQEQSDETGVPGAPEEPAEDDGGGFLDWLGGLFGRAEPDTSSSRAELATVPAMQPTPAVAPGAGPPPKPSPPRPVLEGPGIAIGAEGVAIEESREVARGKAGSSSAPGKTVVDAGLRAEPRGASVIVASVSAGRIAFAPDSAELPADAGAQLEQVVALAKAQGAGIRILGEASVPALALDRARAVGLALVRLGAGASKLEMTLAPGASGDQARLLLTGPGSP